jgi:uncharacterized protein (TIGR02145 family)
LFFAKNQQVGDTTKLNHHNYGNEMKRNQLFGSLPFFPIGVVVLFIAFFIFSGCSKKNPVKSEATTGTMTDQDGNTYKTVKIGNQWWMAENLKVTHYRNGDAIPNVTDSTTWRALTTGAYCNYDNNAGNVATYGRLYNWYAVNDSRNIAPTGWHVPSDAEWQTLMMTLGMSQADADSEGYRGAGIGDKLKESGTTHWSSPNTGATNTSGFSALPGGYRGGGNGYFYDVGAYAGFWSSSEVNSSLVWFRSLSFDHSEVKRYIDWKKSGYSIRLFRD